jgi:hypothetical protein
MSRTVKFTVSVPGLLYKELEALRLRTGMSRSQLVREALRGLEPLAGEVLSGEKGTPAGVREEPARYGGPASALREITDPAERGHRALSAAGRFRSGLPDLSKDHDKYLDDAYAAGGAETESGPKRKP